ncbi:MAG: TonB-dependent receptor, partial [Opitutales bacterium]
LYGPGAAGGVINIVTKSGSGEPSGSFSLEGGSMDTLRTTLTTSGSKQRLSYAFVADHYETEGVSAARSGTETDPHEHDYLQGRLGYALGEGSRLSLFGFKTTAFSGADSGASFDSEAVTKEKNYLVRAQWELTPMNLDWQSTIGFSRKGLYSEDGFGSYYRGYSTEFDLRMEADFHERLSIGAGVEQTDDRGKQQLAWSPDQALRLKSWGGYLNGRLEITDDFFTEVAIRRDDNNHYGGETTGKVAFTRSGNGNWRVLGSVGTFIVAPNAFYLANAKNLYSLKPEAGLGYDLGFERSLGKGRGLASITWFQLETKEQFDWTTWSPSTPSYVVNVDKTKTHGLELELAMDFSDSLALGLAATLQKSRDLTDHRDLFSRPEKMFSGTLDWETPDELVGVNLAFRYVGRRNDATAQPSPSFTVWDLSSTFAVNETMDLHVRVENLFDNDYTEMVDWNGNWYGAFGRSAFLGVTWRY